MTFGTFPHSMDYEIHQEYSAKLTLVENEFRQRIKREQRFGCRACVFATVFLIWALCATAIAWWALTEIGPAMERSRSGQVLYPWPSGVKETNMLLIVNDREQAAEAMELRAERQVKLMAAQATRASAVLPAEQSYNSIAVPIEAEIAEIDEALCGWYKANKKHIEAEGQRSVDLPYGVIGMRRTPPKLVTHGKKVTWQTVVDLIREKYKGKKAKLKELLRTKVEPEKKAIAKLSKEELAEVGCKLTADDEFYVDMKPEALETLKAA